MSTLEAILRVTRRQQRRLRRQRADLERAAAAAPPRASFAGALRSSRVGVIAELKRQSPSAGTIRSNLDPGWHARAYHAGGAAAISVLTEPAFFGGSLDDLSVVAAAVSAPLLRKDFILFEEQLLEARACGASAALLIARALPDVRLRALLAEASGLGLDALVEVHDARELDRALGASAAIIGVNSRNLDTFAMDPVTAWALLSAIPSGLIAVAESGIRGRDGVEAAAAAGADAVLIGGALSAASDPEMRVRVLAQVARHGR